MPNNVINKVVFDGRTLIDLTNTTATASTILSGVGAYGADGVWVDGTAQLGAENGDIYQDEEGYLVLASGAATNINVTSLSVTSNGVYTAPSGVAYTPVNVNVGPARSAADITVSGPNVSGPAGLYSEAFSKAVSIGAASVDNVNATFGPTLTFVSSTGVYGVNSKVAGGNLAVRAATFSPGYFSSYTDISEGSYSTGTNTLTLSKTISNTPQVSAGYIASGTAGNTEVSLTASVNTRSSSDLTASGATVTAPAGYYGSDATKTISSGSATPAASISGSSSTVSTGTNTITLTKTVSNTPQVSAGYISSGTAGNTSVSLTASVTTKEAATITPGTSDQTIASGTYLTGTQTISGDSDLAAANIKSGVQIFNVTGTYTSDATATASDIVDGETAYVDGRLVTGSLSINKYYTGSSAPSSSLGNNGDIYFQA